MLNTISSERCLSRAKTHLEKMDGAQCTIIETCYVIFVLIALAVANVYCKKEVK